MRAGLGFVPEDRRQQGLVMDLSIARNATLTRMRALARARADPRPAPRTASPREWATRLQLKFHRLDDPVGSLSGGNQQKVVLAKWLATEPKVLIVDEPTRGIDVGTKAEVHRLLCELAGRGVAVLMISSELPEVLGMADRVLVMHEGRLTGELSRPRPTRSASCARRPAGGGGGMSAHATATAEGGRARRLTEWVFRVRELGIVVALALLIAVTAVLEPRFVEADSLRNLALNASIFAILAAGQTLVIITRNVDLSVGSVLGLSAFMAGDLLSAPPGPRAPGRVRCSGWRSARPAALLNGVLVDLRPGAGARRHARHALRVPRPRVPVDGRPPGQRRDAARRVPEPRHRLDRSASRPSR